MDAAVVVFLAALVVVWGGLLLCFRRVILGVTSIREGREFLHANENEQRQVAPVTPGWAQLDGWTFLGIALAVVGYLVMCFVMIFWVRILGVLMLLSLLVVVPAVALWRARH